MPVVIRTNMESMIVQQNLNSATNALNVFIERMTTGYRINHASDNAANYSIAKNWVKQLSSLDVVTDNTAMGKDMLATTEDNYSIISTHLGRIRDLTEQAANGTYGIDSLKAIKSEIQARLEEISRIAENAEFNGINLMGSTSSLPNGVDLQVGLNGTNNDKINLPSTIFANSTVNGLFKTDAGLMDIVKSANGGTAVSDLNTETGYAALAAAFSGLKKSGDDYVIQTEADYKPAKTLTSIDSVIDLISSRNTALGAAENKLDSAAEALSIQIQNVTSSLSTIRDTDVAAESSAYIQAQILQQASATLLSTANQMPTVALNLL